MDTLWRVTPTGSPLTHSRPPAHMRWFSFRDLGALPAHDLLAVYIGFGSISHRDSLHVCAAFTGTPEQKTDSSFLAHCRNRNATRVRRKSCTPRGDDRWPSAIATEPRQSSGPGVIYLCRCPVPNWDLTGRSSGHTWPAMSRPLQQCI